MKLKLYSSRRGDRAPNLVSIQHPSLSALPTVLVCPLKPNEAVTHLRTTLEWKNEIFTVLCDLARPINRNALVELGEVDETTSQLISKQFSNCLLLNNHGMKKFSAVAANISSMLLQPPVSAENLFPNNRNRDSQFDSQLCFLGLRIP